MSENAATNWWLHETAQGRRLLDRVVPSSAIPAATRRRICDEQGHRLHGNSCTRCGELVEPCRCVYPDKCFCSPEAKRLRRREDARGRGR